MYRRFVAAVLAVAFAVLVAPSLAVAESAAKAAPTSKINLNTASAEQLATLPGVGPALAGRIVEYRQKSGSFRATKDVMNVKGIGEKNFAKIESWLTVGDAPKAAASK
jgi:competence protein ComEA